MISIALLSYRRETLSFVFSPHLQHQIANTGAEAPRWDTRSGAVLLAVVALKSGDVSNDYGIILQISHDQPITITKPLLTTNHYETIMNHYEPLWTMNGI